MTIDFSKYLTVEQQKAILTQNLEAWASDHYASSLNAKIAGEAGNQEAVDASLANMAKLEAAGAAAEAELATLEVPVV